MFSYLSPEQRVPQDHPLRAVRVIVDQSLTERDGHFSRIYIRPWPSFPSPGASPSCLAAASLLQHPLGAAADGADGLQPAVPLFRWFVGLGMDAPVWVPTVLSRICGAGM